MSLCESLQRFLEAEEINLKDLKENTREYVVVSCRVMYIRNLIQILVIPPVPKEDILKVREEFKKLVFNATYVGNGHQHLLDAWDRGNKDILF